MAVKKKRVVDLSKVKVKIKKRSDSILYGTFLAIDPSIGSNKSYCGYALFKNAELVESGNIEVKLSGTQSERLHELSKSLREDFDEVDLLVLEKISPVVYRNSFMNATSVASLQRAVGAILAAVDWKEVIEISPKEWKVFVPKDYVKTDNKDAEQIGIAAITIARSL